MCGRFALRCRCTGFCAMRCWRTLRCRRSGEGRAATTTGTKGATATSAGKAAGRR